MVDAEQAREAAMWFVVLASATLAAARFASYVGTVRLVDVGPAAAVAWWSTYVVGLGLVLAGLFGQRDARYDEGHRAWLALLVGILVLVVMPSDPAAAVGLGLVAPASRPAA